MSIAVTRHRPRRAPAHLPDRSTAAILIVLAIAGLLRMWALHRVPGNTFYDAAVRSMGRSWHSFFFGALEPSGQIAVDKPPIDLWLQVLSTKAIGFGRTALHAPEAAAGVAAVAVLFETVRRVFGTPAACVSALALAVLPVSVLTARSDTMDSVLSALSVIALALSCVGLATRRARWVLAAAAVMGVAFNVKLTEAFIPLPALGLLWWWAASGAPRARVRLLGLAALVFTGVSLSWATLASLTPASHRPFPIGSTDGSIWRLMFVYNGSDRLTGRGPLGFASATAAGRPGPLRLFGTGGIGYGSVIGTELLGALAFGALAAGLGWQRRRRSSLRRRGSDRSAALEPAGGELRHRVAIALGVWLITGVLLFSIMQRLQSRYLESFSPAVSAALGIGLMALVGDRRHQVRVTLAAMILALGAYLLVVDGSYGFWTVVSLVAVALAVATSLVAAVRSRAVGAGGRSPGGRDHVILAVAATIAVLGAPVGVALALVEHHRSDSVLADPSTPALSRYLKAHRRGARFEVVSFDVFDVMGIVSRDGLPVLVLNDLHGPILGLKALTARVTSGQVRFFYEGQNRFCRPGASCPTTVGWALAHSHRVAHQAGLYRFY